MKSRPDPSDPMPKPLMTAEHLNDVAIIPMQMITGRYAEAGLDDGLRAKFHRLYEPHMYTPKSFFPPYDKSARRYTFWLEDGLSAGGIEFDESVIGGPAKNLEQFCPGVIQWDSGNHGAGCGWLSVSPCNTDSANTRYGLRPRALPSLHYRSLSPSACRAPSTSRTVLGLTRSRSDLDACPACSSTRIHSPNTRRLCLVLTSLSEET